MDTKEPLQKLTESLTKEERQAHIEKINANLNTLKGDDLDSYWEEILKRCPGQDMRSQRWENNHQEIIRVISNFLKENNQIPTKNQIANITGISRQTVHKHLLEFQKSEFYQVELLKLRILNQKVMAKVYQEAAGGSIKAARLFFEMTGALGNRNAKNYYIQINNLRVDEKLIRSLPAEARTEIETIINKSIPDKLTPNQNGS